MKISAATPNPATPIQHRPVPRDWSLHTIQLLDRPKILTHYSSLTRVHFELWKLDSEHSKSV